MRGGKGVILSILKAGLSMCPASLSTPYGHGKAVVLRHGHGHGQRHLSCNRGRNISSSRV